jgi:flagellar hook assembly protein FlgD
VQRAAIAITALLAAFAAAPQLAAAANVETVELTRVGPRTFEARGAVSQFTLAGVHWRGAGSVQLRTRSTSGRWSPWRAGAPEDEDGPDPGVVERSPRGWRIGNPWWVGASDRIQVRSRGSVSRVRAHLVWSPETLIPWRTPAATVTPTIIPRASWGADESIRRAPPSYAPELRVAVVHHTAGRNGYSRAEAAAIVKGIQLFHVQGNGWNDIGYNFLVDRFGTIYEGRFGGVDRNVIGAHAQGFNTGSVGIALLGTYGSTAPSQAALDAITRIVSWKLDVAHVDPTASLTYVSSGSNRYANRVPVVLDAVSGHRDTGYTACPGDSLYARLGAIASAARALGGPKIFEPLTEPEGTAIRLRARLSGPLPWIVRITGQDGVEVARGSGTGPTVDWTWESAGSAEGTYTWTITAGSARPASGTLRAGSGAVPLAISGLTAVPEAVSPNGDGQADTTAVTYSISTPANVSVEIVDATGTVLVTVVDRVWTRAGQHVTTVDPAALPDGSYGIVVTARTAAGAVAEKVVPLSVNRTLGLVSVASGAFSPNADGRKDRLKLTFELTTPAEVRVRIERDGRWVATPVIGAFEAGSQQLLWDGARASGMLRDGTYEAVVEATTPVGTISFAVPFVSDTAAPRVRVLPGRALRVEVSEPSMLTLVVDGQALKREVRKAGIVRIPWPGEARRVRVVAWDAAGNSSTPAVRLSRG